MSEKPLVAVVMVNWNTAEVTLKCVESVQDSDYPSFRVLVVDNGSRPEEVDLLRLGLPDTVALLALDKNYGYVGGVNRGLKQAEQLSPKYILVMNNDTVIDTKAISELVEAAQRHADQCIVTGIVYDYHEPSLVQQCGSQYTDRRKLIYKPYCSNRKDPGFGEVDIEMDMIDDVFWLLPQGVLKKVGYYSDYFWFNDEQADYALRAVETGFKLIFTSQARIWHMGSLSIGGRQSNPIREYFDTKSRLIFRYRHMRRIDFLFHYLSTVMQLGTSLIRNTIKKIAGRPDNSQVSLARWQAIGDFSRWLYKKEPDRGEIPQRLKRMDNAVKNS